jgi:hypothetical protein
MIRAKFSIELHRNPPVLHLTERGSVYQIRLNDGSTSMMIGDIPVPVQGCPFPSELARARFWAFLHRNFNNLVTTFAIVLSLVMLHVLLMITYPGEMIGATVSVFSFWMNAALVVTGSAALIAWTVRRFWGGVTIKFGVDEEMQLLTAGSINIAPDVLIASESLDESPESFEGRMRSAFEETTGTQKWVLVVPRGQWKFMVIKNSDLPDAKPMYSEFLRSAPFDPMPFGELEIARDSNLYTKESYGSYLEYLRHLTDEYRIWSEAAKQGAVDPFASIANAMKKAMNTITLLLMFTLSMSAQKTTQLAAYLGDRATISAPEAGKQVDFVFERREISVRANGKANYIDLIQSVPFFSDADDAGRLLLVKVDGQKILPKDPAKAVEPKAELKTEKIGDGSVSEVPVDLNSSMFDQIPDSAAFQKMKYADLADKRRQWAKVEPMVDYYMWKFYLWLPLLAVIFAYFWWVASLGSAESVDDLLGHAVVGNIILKSYVISKAMLFVLLILIGAVFSLQWGVTYYYTYDVSFWMLVRIALIAWLSYQVSKKVLPNLKRDTPAGGVVYNGRYNNRQLPG